jgi:hypothetical protein
LAPRDLKLNEEKTRVADSRDGFNFLGFAVGWQRSRRSGNWYAHVEASARSAQPLREVVRSKLNHWTLGRLWPLPTRVAWQRPIESNPNAVR